VMCETWWLFLRGAWPLGYGTFVRLAEYSWEYVPCLWVGEAGLKDFFTSSTHTTLPSPKVLNSNRRILSALNLSLCDGTHDSRARGGSKDKLRKPPGLFVQG
jgi:hypothetical protein